MNIPSLIKTAIAVFFFAIVLQDKGPPGISEFYSVSKEIHRSYFSLSDLVLVIGTITGILGGLRIYTNWQIGKKHIDIQVIGWFLSCLFLVLISAFLRALYRVN